MELPADQVDVDGAEIRLTAANGSWRLTGELDGDAITGTAVMGHQQLPVRLGRAGTAQPEALAREVRERLDALRSGSLELVQEGPGVSQVNSDALESLLDDARSSHSTALALMIDGEMVGEWYLDGQREPIYSMSVTKAALHLVIGRLITRGLLESIDIPVHEFFPQWADDDQRARITLRHLMAHTSGIDRGQPAMPIYESGDFVGFALNAPLEFEPGTEVAYSNNGTNLLVGIVARVIEQPLQDFLADDLFGQLGIEQFAWHSDSAGNPQGMSGLVIRAGDLARLGQLALDRGRFGDEQLIDAEWFEQSFVPASEHSARLGLIWFLMRDDEDNIVGASHSGYLGQWLGLYFEERIVGVRMVRQSPAYDPETDAFPEFLSLLPTLAGDD